MISLVTQGSETIIFSYGPNRELVKRVDARSAGINTTTLLIDNLYEQVQLASGVTEHKFVIGNAIVTRRTVGGPQVYYLHKDQQGSTTAITNHDGNAVQQLLYDPWGRQYQVSAAVLTYSSQATTYGYTGHDMVNDFEVIHMGGRSYNPVLGRFMQANPFIQQASNLQSFNRYAYVLNNPMSYTDPSGYFFKKLFNAIKENWRTLAAITIAAYMPHMAFIDGLSAIQAGALTGFVSGGVATGSLRGALADAFTGAMFGKLHNMTTGIGKVLAHGVAGGISSLLNDGKFGHGFLSAGLTQTMGSVEGLFANAPQGIVRLGNAIKAAVIGGTISELTGGKFASGALTGAFSRLLNDDIAGWKRSQSKVQDEKLAVGAASKAFAKVLGVRGAELGVEIDSDGNITLSGGLDLDNLKISVNSNMEAKVVGGPDALVGESFYVNDSGAQKAVASYGIVELSVASYDNGIVNFDVQLGVGAYIKYTGGFDLKNWRSTGQYIRAIHSRESYINNYICKNVNGVKGC